MQLELRVRLRERPQACRDSLVISLMTVLALGFILGMRHATDADHVVAVTTIISHERSAWRAAGIGLLWGLGHTMTIVVVGGAILVFGWVVPPRLGLSLEFSVGIMLVILGGWSFWALWREARAARNASPTSRPDAAGPAQTRDHHGMAKARPLAVGIVHGLAGSAAVALLVLPLIQDRAWAAIYLLVFGAGTVAGMMLITAAFALPFTWTAAHASGFNRGLARVAAGASVAFGAFLLYEIGFAQGLFVD